MRGRALDRGGLLGTGVESSLSPFYPCALAGQPQWQSFRNEPDALPATTLCSCSTPEVLGDAWRRFCLPQLGEGLLLASSRQRSRTLLNIPQCPDNDTALTDNDPAQKVSSAKDDKLLFPHLCSQVEPVDPKVVVTSIFCD